MKTEKFGLRFAAVLDMLPYVTDVINFGSWQIRIFVCAVVFFASSFASFLPCGLLVLEVFSCFRSGFTSMLVLTVGWFFDTNALDHS